MSFVSEETKSAARNGDVGAMLAWARTLICADNAEDQHKAEEILAIAEGRRPRDIYGLSHALDAEIRTNVSGDYSRVFARDMELAVLLSQQAAAQGDGEANHFLGEQALQNKNPAEAVSYYTAAAKAGNARSMVYLAYLKIIGLGIKKETAAGFNELQQLAIQATTATENVYIAHLYAVESLVNFTFDSIFCFYLLNGEESKILRNKNRTADIDKVEEYYTGETLSRAFRNNSFSADKTETPDENTLEKKDPSFKGRTKKALEGDITALVAWSQDTQEYRHNSTALGKLVKEINGPLGRFRCFDLGTFFYSRDGDNQLAALWYKAAFNRGDAVSAECLARIAALKGDNIDAALWLKNAAEKGSTSGLYKYGLCQIFGIGLPTDKKEGLKTIQKVADAISTQSHGVKQALITIEKQSVCVDCISMFLSADAIEKLKNPEGRIDIAPLERYFGMRPFVSPAPLHNILPTKNAQDSFVTPAYKYKEIAPLEQIGKLQNIAAAPARTPPPDNITSQPPRMAPVMPTLNPMQELNALIGLQDVKESVKGIANRMAFAKMRENAGLSTSNFNLHFVFSGNPGTGKTTVARILGQILHSVGYLAKGHVIEVSANDLIGEYVGTTAPKTTARVMQAMGGILFIDEAYSLMAAQGANGKSFSGECIATLLKLMEDKRTQFVIVAAGYPNEMREFVNFNPGFSSRFTEYISFPDYKAEELEKIFMKMLTDNEYALEPEGQDYLKDIMQKAPALFDKNFPNGRFVRNFYEDCEQCMSNRVMAKFADSAQTAGLSDLTTMEKADLEKSYDMQKTAAKIASERIVKNPIGFLQSQED